MIHYLRYFFVVACLFACPYMVFSQSSDIEVKMETLLNAVRSGTKVHINKNTGFIEIYQEKASYKIPYLRVSCSYLFDSGQRHMKLKTHCVDLKCLTKYESKGCDLKVKYADGWRGVTAATIVFDKKEDVHEFIELVAHVKKETK